MVLHETILRTIDEKEQRPFYTSDIVMKICEKLDLDC